MPNIILFMIFLFVIGLLSIPFIWQVISQKEKKFSLYPKLALFLSGLVIAACVIGLILFTYDQEKQSGWANFLVLFVTPIASLAGFYLVYENFKSQSEIAIKREILDLIELHKSIRSEVIFIELKNSDPSSDDKMIYQGREAFKKTLELFNDIYPNYQNSLNNFILHTIASKGFSALVINRAELIIEENLKNDNFSNEETLNFIKENYHTFKDKIIRDDFLKKLSYEEFVAATLYIQIYFENKTCREYLSQRLDFKPIYFFSYLNNFTFLRKFEIVNNSYFVRQNYRLSSLESVFEHSKSFFPENNILDGSIVYNHDLHLHLDIYFRNLYNAYNIIAKIENKNIREDAARLLRTQISSYEQAVIFLNSLSPMGQNWQKTGNRNILKKFNVLKNMSDAVLVHIKPSEIYKVEDGFVYEHLNYQKKKSIQKS